MTLSSRSTTELPPSRHFDVASLQVACARWRDDRPLTWAPLSLSAAAQARMPDKRAGPPTVNCLCGPTSRVPVTRERKVTSPARGLRSPLGASATARHPDSELGERPPTTQGPWRAGRPTPSARRGWVPCRRRSGSAVVQVANLAAPPDPPQGMGGRGGAGRAGSKLTWDQAEPSDPELPARFRAAIVASTAGMPSLRVRTSGERNEGQSGLESGR